MTNSNAKRVREIFEEAIELSEAERQAFLELACAEDSQLRSAVDRLIEAYEADASNMTKTRSSERLERATLKYQREDWPFPNSPKDRRRRLR